VAVAGLPACAELPVDCPSRAGDIRTKTANNLAAADAFIPNVGFPCFGTENCGGWEIVRRAFPRKAGGRVEQLVLKSDSLRRLTATVILLLRHYT